MFSLWFKMGKGQVCASRVRVFRREFGFWGPLSGVRLCFVGGGQIVGISPTPSGS